jgi:hypothetical protein
MSLLAIGLVAGLLAGPVSQPASVRAQAGPWLEEDFSSGVDVFNAGAWGMNPTDAGHVGPGLRSVMPTGEHWGSSGHWYFEDEIGSEPEELWWRYWVKFDANNYIQPPHRGKLPGPANLHTYNCLGGRPSTAGGECWSARMMFARDYPRWPETGPADGREGETRIGFYVYHLDQDTQYGDPWDWDRNVAVLPNGEWYCLEGHISLNTPGSADGVLEGWVDGTEAFARDDVRFRRSTESWLDIKSFWFDIYYGGGQPSPVDNVVTFDSLALGSNRIGCDDSGSFDGRFHDDDGSTFEPDIEWLAEEGITLGCNPPQNNAFCPDDPVTRGQMAAFLARALTLPASDVDWFRDDDGSTFEVDIGKIAEAGVTLGCDAGLYCPDEFVTRGQMAAFLVRAYDLAPGDGVEFSDDDGSTFEDEIEALAAAGVTFGCEPGRYCPDDFVTRGQMAAFLHRAAG